MNTIAVDAMGGDSAPIDIVKGAIKAKDQGVDVVLCGDKNLINPYLENHEIPVFDFPQVISMDEDPLKAIRNKKNASIVGCMQLLKDKKVQAVFSAGSTGATLISAISILGKHKGVIRPVICNCLLTALTKLCSSGDDILPVRAWICSRQYLHFFKHYCQMWCVFTLPSAYFHI
jgi:glycerol-3-phosphate acyltransferase PlsX